MEELPGGSAGSSIFTAVALATAVAWVRCLAQEQLHAVGITKKRATMEINIPPQTNGQGGDIIQNIMQILKGGMCTNLWKQNILQTHGLTGGKDKTVCKV